MHKGGARGGSYYRRVPTGNPKRPWRYYYSRKQYESAHGDEAHVHGPEIASGAKKSLVRGDLRKHVDDKLVYLTPGSRKTRLEW
ncbi:hypothetical protein K0U83_23210 [bacterium]|nr:hypothetical protein [bacterium]